MTWKYMLGFFLIAASCVSKGNLKEAQINTSNSLSQENQMPDCLPLPKNASSLLTPGSFVLLGEMHGTKEAPEFLHTLVCHAAKQGSEVWIGLEIPREESVRIETYLQSQGNSSDKDSLLAGDFWTRSYQDGRSSIATLEFFESMRNLRQAGKKVHPFLFDRSEYKEPEERDQKMAEAILEVREKAPNALFLILSGNIHTRTQKGAPWDPDFLPMGFFLLEKEPSLQSFNIAYSGDSAWVCMGPSETDCGETPLQGKDRGEEQFVELFSEPDSFGYTGIYYLVKIHASPPAVQKGTLSLKSKSQ